MFNIHILMTSIKNTLISHHKSLYIIGGTYLLIQKLRIQTNITMSFTCVKSYKMQLSHIHLLLFYICKSHFDHLMHKNTIDLLKGNVTAYMKKVVRKPLSVFNIYLPLLIWCNNFKIKQVLGQVGVWAITIIFHKFSTYL